MTTTMFGKHKLEVWDEWSPPEVWLTVDRSSGPRGYHGAELVASYREQDRFVVIEGMEYEGDQRISLPIEAFTAFMTEVAKMRAQRPTDSEGDAAT